jgi:hypothetical protein
MLKTDDLHVEKTRNFNKVTNSQGRLRHQGHEVLVSIEFSPRSPRLRGDLHSYERACDIQNDNTSCCGDGRVRE